MTETGRLEPAHALFHGGWALTGRRGVGEMLWKCAAATSQQLIPKVDGGKFISLPEIIS